MATRKVIPVKQITSWSFSRYSDHRTCPAKAKYKHVDKLKEPSNEAMERGSRIHTLAEQYVKGDIAKLPPELALMKAEFAALRKAYKSKKLPMIVEDNWAFTRDWSETQWNDWVGCWVRIKLDLAHYTGPDDLLVTDWKTGKMNEHRVEEYMEQLELYVLSALLMSSNDNVRVTARLGFLDHGVWYPEPDDVVVYTKADIPKLKKAWEQRTKAMMNDTRFAPKPNYGCKWCHFRKSNGGPCQY